jgi:hypothetical protein
MSVFTKRVFTKRVFTRKVFFAPSGQNVFNTEEYKRFLFFPCGKKWVNLEEYEEGFKESTELLSCYHFTKEVFYFFPAINTNYEGILFFPFGQK